MEIDKLLTPFVVILSNHERRIKGKGNSPFDKLADTESDKPDRANGIVTFFSE